MKLSRMLMAGALALALPGVLAIAQSQSGHGTGGAAPGGPRAVPGGLPHGDGDNCGPGRGGLIARGPRGHQEPTSRGGAATGGSGAHGTAATTGTAPAAGAVAVTPAPSTRPHGPTTSSLLKIDWDYPVWSGGPSTGASASEHRGALPREDALRFIAGSDPRPLLVVRECPCCNKTDRALLVPGTDNERTILLSHWFHCVKLATDVAQEDHPLHALFPRSDAEHLFVSAADGAGRVALEATTSRPELWAAMGRTLQRAYGDDQSQACRQLASLIEGFDLVDQRLADLQEKRSRLLERGKLDAGEQKSIDEEIARLRGELARDVERAQGIPKLEAPQRSAGG